ncbi:septum site-determining protein MinC [Zhaonella formicivorans]|jgi:septum site-determining protein MinC|uniref:septum site-determining protein MinC n=1 Tax=Zhaonella formicivorans TaxID=2528593 RepID=UPI001D1036F6|nr:septum site-determining protein MinC [Zhaonella formicivorans]
MKISTSTFNNSQLMGQPSSLLAKKRVSEATSSRDDTLGIAQKEFGTVHDDVAISDENTILIQRTIRSGQSIRYPGNVVVMGDVNPGGEIVAGGNIIVMGHLRGVAHAGATGSEKAVVAAFRLQPTQLRIANHITRAPDGEEIKPDQPEIARIQNGVVVIEKYHPNSNRHLNLF